MKSILVLILVAPSLLWALSDEEKTRGCKELTAQVLPGQRDEAMARCLEFAVNDCERIERMLLETCVERSHTDNAIRYDFERGTTSACQAGVIKRQTQRGVCESLRRDCQSSKIKLGGGGAQATCQIFRAEDDKKICVEVERHAKRVIAAEQSEKSKCPPLKGN